MFLNNIPKYLHAHEGPPPGGYRCTNEFSHFLILGLPKLGGVGWVHKIDNSFTSFVVSQAAIDWCTL